MGVNEDSETILGVIKKISIAGDKEERYYEGEPHYQIEWVNDLHPNVWYRDGNIYAFKETYRRYMNGEKLEDDE